MSLKLIRITVVLAIVAATPVAASAQIHTWRDAAGNLVLSDRPKDGAMMAFPVSSGDTVLTTRPVAGKRTTAYDGLIAEHSTRHGVRSELIRAVIQAESAFNPFARSVKGAMGLMQLMPATAAQYRVLDAYDPAENIRAGVAYLKGLLQRYSQNEELALAAYNAGPGAVAKYGGVVPPYRETRDYVSKITKQAGSRPPPTRVYKVVEMKDGQEFIRYTNVPPAGAAAPRAAVARAPRAAIVAAPRTPIIAAGSTE
jgi:soluble lytic murein transglycosylase-like protein